MHQQLKGSLKKLCHLSNVLGAIDGTVPKKPHSKGAFGLSVIFDLAFLFIEEI